MTIDELVEELDAVISNYNNSSLQLSDEKRNDMKERIAYLKIGIQYLTNRELNENQYPTGEKLHLAQDYKCLFYKYVFVFCEKQNCELDGWMPSNEDGIDIANTWVSYGDLRFDVDNSVPEGCIFEYNEYCMDNPENRYNYENFLLLIKGYNYRK